MGSSFLQKAPGVSFYIYNSHSISGVLCSKSEFSRVPKVARVPQGLCNTISVSLPYSIHRGLRIFSTYFVFTILDNNFNTAGYACVKFSGIAKGSSRGSMNPGPRLLGAPRAPPRLGTHGGHLNPGPPIT